MSVSGVLGLSVRKTVGHKVLPRYVAACVQSCIKCSVLMVAEGWCDHSLKVEASLI